MTIFLVHDGSYLNLDDGPSQILGHLGSNFCTDPLVQVVEPCFAFCRAVIRYQQLHFRAWFAMVWSAPRAAEARRVPEPNIMEAFNKMDLGDMSWLPLIPTKYTTSRRSAPAVTDDDASPPRRPVQTVVTNTHYNTRFAEFDTGLQGTTLAAAIRSAGPPPMVTRSGQQVQMCLSYHLRQSCFTNCGRRADHRPHSEAEDDTLFNWCRQAFA